MSLRTLTRALPRHFIRPNQLIAPRSICSIQRIVPLQTSFRLSTFNPNAAFSTSRIAHAKEGQVDPELSEKLQTELEMETEMRDPENLPTSISDYLSSSSFELHDTPGREDVVLTRKFGDENIRVSFSIADLNNIDPDEEAYNEDPALEEEGEEANPSNIPGSAQSGGANTKGTVNQGYTPGGNINVAPEDRIAPADREDLADEPDPSEDAGANEEPSFPARINVAIQKKGKGTLQIETVAEDGEIQINSVNYFRDTKLAQPETAEAQWKRGDLYEGPPFGNLDEDLQLMLEKYLDERGINTQLALWVPEYIDFKEQREYLNWLSNVKEFVDA